MDFTCCGPCNVLTAEELSEANAVASERVEVVKFKDTSSTFSRFCCSRRRPQRGTVREVTLSSAEHAWRSNYGRYKYCGLRPDPCRGKPPEMQDMHRVSQLRSPDVVDVAGVQKLQRRLADLSDCRTDFGTLLRFYREGDGKPPAAEEAFRAAMDWQRQHDVGRALTHWNLELYERVLASWWPSGGFLGHGREGEPVALERLGRADWSTLYDNVPYEVLQKMDIVHCLRTLSGCEEDALRRGEAFVNATLVQDLEGISWSRFKPSSLKTLGKLLKTRMYLVPRTGRRVLIVNAPPAFVRVWSTIKNLVVHPSTAQLIEIVGKARTLEVLRKYLDDDVIPAYLGGTRTIDGDPECRTLLAPGGTPPQEALTRVRQLVRQEARKDF